MSEGNHFHRHDNEPELIHNHGPTADLSLGHTHWHTHPDTDYHHWVIAAESDSRVLAISDSDD